MKFKTGDHIVGYVDQRPLITSIEIEKAIIHPTLGPTYYIKIYKEGKVLTDNPYPADKIDALFMVDPDWAIERLFCCSSFRLDGLNNGHA